MSPLPSPGIPAENLNKKGRGKQHMTQRTFKTSSRHKGEVTGPLSRSQPWRGAHNSRVSPGHILTLPKGLGPVTTTRVAKARQQQKPWTVPERG